MANKANQVRKITIKEVFGDRAAVRACAEKAKGKVANLFSIVGVVDGVKPGSTDKGEYLRLIGTFEATNLESGEVFQSGAAILPNFLSEGVGAALMRPNASAVQFAIVIGAKTDEKSVTGYVYTGENLMPPSEHSPLVALKGQLEKLLPAPKK